MTIGEDHKTLVGDSSKLGVDESLRAVVGHAVDLPDANSLVTGYLPGFMCRTVDFDVDRDCDVGPVPAELFEK